jgi:GNAT superfamily N-acetyltransferase
MEIAIWNNQEFEQHVKAKNYPTWQHSNGHKYFLGFNFIGPRFVEQRPAFDKGECTFKVPEVKTFINDRHIVALDNSDLIGVFSLMYGFYNYSFVHYYPRILEVRKDKQNQGIATALVSRLEQPCFLHGQVLMVRAASYTADGRKYLKRIFDREITGKHFRFVDGSMTNLNDYSNQTL